MKLQFDANLGYQEQAVFSVVDLFKGQTPMQSNFTVSACSGQVGLYEPSHGSAPDIAGQKKANPLATILSAAMMLRYSFDLESEARLIEAAVRQVMEDGYRTPDLMEEGKTLVDTAQMGDLVQEVILKS